MKDDEKRVLYQIGGRRNLKKQKTVFPVYFDMYLYDYDVAVFALIFLYYTNSFLIRRRKKELGLYNILGMGKRNLVRILLWENILTAAVSLIIGIVFGILFSKLAELLAVKLLDGATGFGISIEGKPILMTVGLFLVIFLLIMARMLVSVYKLRPSRCSEVKMSVRNRRKQTGFSRLQER